MKKDFADRNYFLKVLLCTVAALTMIASAKTFADEQVLIVQDERPQMLVLEKYLKQVGELKVITVEQKSLPQRFSDYKSIIAFLHHKLEETAEVALLDYARKGGRLICLHPSISRGKQANKYYFPAMGIKLENTPLEEGGYAYREGISYALVNLMPAHFITSHEITWGEKTAYTRSDGPDREEKMLPSIELHETEVYLNHQFTDSSQKILLCGLKFYDEKTRGWFMQDRAAWLKHYGQGEIIYFMPGHRPSDYENRNIAQMILNAILWRE